MELFIIQCTTCRARLKVNDGSVIGDILACPKCGSMVQVVPPVDWKRAGEPATGVDVAESHREAPDSSRQTSQPSSKAAALLPPMLPQRASPQPAGDTVQPATATAAPASPPVTGPAKSDSIATTPGLSAAIFARIERDWITLGCGLAAGIVLGASAWLMMSGDRVDVPAAAATQASDEDPTTRLQSDPQSVAVQPETDREPPQVQGAAVAERIALTHKVNAPNDQPPIEAPTPDAVPVVAAPPAIADKPNTATETAGPPRIKLEPVEKRATPPQPDRDAAAVSTAELAPAADESQAAPPPAAKRAVEPDSSSADAGTPKLTGEEIDERLSGPLPAIKFVDVPLGQFVDFISSFAGLPISIDEPALAKVGKARQTPVTVRLKETTAHEALNRAVASLGLTCSVRDGRLVVTTTSK